MKLMVVKCLVLACSFTPMLAAAHAISTVKSDGADESSANFVSSSHRIEGLWDEQVIQVDCRSAAPLHPIGRGTNLFIRGGALVATNNAPPTVMGITLGEWRYVGGDGKRFRVRMRLNLFQPPLETFVGYREIVRDIVLSNHGNNLSGAVLAQDYFPEGSPNGSPICATESGSRISSP